MADDTKKPKPQIYNPLLDKSIDTILADYHSLHTEKAEKEFQKERGNDRDTLYATVVSHLQQHGVDKKTGKLTRFGYHDMSPADKKTAFG